MYAIAVFLTYNLQFYVPFSLLWPRLSRKVLYKYGEDTIEKFEHAFRIGLIFITCKSIEKSTSTIRTHLVDFSSCCCNHSESWSCHLSRYVIVVRSMSLHVFHFYLVGAVASTALSIIFPPICESITFWPDGLGRYKWQLILNLVIISFGLYVFIAGTTLSVSNILSCIRLGVGCDN